VITQAISGLLVSICRPLVLIGLIGASAVAACTVRTGHEPVPIAPPLEAEISQQMAAHDAMAWSATRPLTWKDFRGTAPSGGMEGAQTAYSLFYGLRCTRSLFQFQVTTGFLPRESWVKPSVVANADESRRTLEHEQTHFDLSEVYARRMRKYFADLYRPCDQTLDRWRTVAQQYIRDEAAAQGRYDGETRHGLTLARQRAWGSDIVRQLKELDAFAR
jgi:hypothetical protein